MWTKEGQTSLHVYLLLLMLISNLCNVTPVPTHVFINLVYAHFSMKLIFMHTKNHINYFSIQELLDDKHFFFFFCTDCIHDYGWHGTTSGVKIWQLQKQPSVTKICGFDVNNSYTQNDIMKTFVWMKFLLHEYWREVLEETSFPKWFCSLTKALFFEG